tara:strand:+ start:211 stop:603 length:393 start_codon:yes stop_codon:yes gene_type:complete
MTNTTAKCAIRYNFSDAKWMGICQYYSNHTAPATLAYFDLELSPFTLSYHYKRLGFLPKSAARNPDPARTAAPKPLPKGKMNTVIKRGGYIMNGRVMSATEFGKLRSKLKVGDTFKVVTVTQHKVGIMDA